MTSTNDWLHFHQSNPSTADEAATPYTTTMASNLYSSGRAFEPNMVPTTMSTRTMISPPLMGQAQTGPSPDRVSKPARKRTRASRRTPTTLLKTDTTNFRALVQKFTGGPSNNIDIQRPGPQMYNQSYGLQLPMGQLQQPILSTLQYSMPSNNNNNNNSNIMFMQRATGENINTNIMRLSGSIDGSSSNNNFYY